MSRTPNRRPLTQDTLPAANPTPAPPPVDGLPAPLAGTTPEPLAHPLDAAALPSGKPARLTNNDEVTAPLTGLTVEESDGSPSITNVSTIRTSGIAVSSPAAGVALLTAAGGGSTQFVGAWGSRYAKSSTAAFNLEWAVSGATVYDPDSLLVDEGSPGNWTTKFISPADAVYAIFMQIELSITGTRESWYPRLELYVTNNDQNLSAYRLASHQMPSMSAGGTAVTWALTDYITLGGWVCLPLLAGAKVYGRVEFSYSGGSGTPSVFVGDGNFVVFKVGEIPA